MAMGSIRGLQMFITDIRNCQSKDQERARVDKELNKIRLKFSYEKSLSSYDKKKYVWKLLYIYILGYQLDFGQREALALVGSHKYSEKQVGYMVAGCLLHENHDYLNFITKSIRLDITGRNETFQCLALSLVANVGGKDFAEALAPDVQKLMVSGSCRPLVRKKAVLCLLHIYRKYPEAVQDDIWPEHMSNLLDEKDCGVLLAVMTLLVALAGKNSRPYFICISKCVRILERLLRNHNIPQDYTFYGVPSPWLQVKTLQALQLLPVSDDPTSVRVLLQLLERVVIGTDISHSINRTNVLHAVLFEAMALIIQVDTERSLISRCMASLEKFVSLRDPNIRCLGMGMMAKMLTVAESRDSVKMCEVDIMLALRDGDKSIQKVAVDLLYEACDATNAKQIVELLLEHFRTADYNIQEIIAAKAGLLAEKFATDCAWYVDVILQLVEKGGGLVPDDIWLALLQCVAQHDEIQVYAATKAREHLNKPTVHETMIKIAGSLLGDNSHLLAQKPGYSPKEVFWALHNKFPNVSTSTKAIMLASYIKLLLNTEPADEELEREIFPLFEKYGEYLDADLQQRAVGYFSLSQKTPNLRAVTESERQEAGAKPSRQLVQRTSIRQPEIDLLGDLLGSEEVSANLLSVGAPFSEDPFSAFAPQPPPVQPTVNVMELFSALCKKDSGMLYEDPYVQVGIQSQWQGPRGEIIILLSNKQTEILTSVRVNVLPEPHLKVETATVPQLIPPAEQTQVPVKVTCLYAGRKMPVLELSYVVSGIAVASKLQLPIVLSKFLQPATISAHDFFASWRALAAAPNKLQEVIRGVRFSSVSALADTLKSLRVCVADGLDPNPNNIVAASTFNSETGGALLCMVRLETDPADKTQLRLTVASPNARLASEIKEYLKEQLLICHPLSASSASTAPPGIRSGSQLGTSIRTSLVGPQVVTPVPALNQKPQLVRSLTATPVVVSSSPPSSDPLADLLAPSDFAALAKPSSSSTMVSSSSTMVSSSQSPPSASSAASSALDPFPSSYPNPQST